MEKDIVGSRLPKQKADMNTGRTEKRAGPEDRRKHVITTNNEDAHWNVIKLVEMGMTNLTSQEKGMWSNEVATSRRHLTNDDDH